MALLIIYAYIRVYVFERSYFIIKYQNAMESNSLEQLNRINYIKTIKDPPYKQCSSSQTR